MNRPFFSTLRKFLFFSILIALVAAGLGMTIQSAPAAPSTTINVTTPNDELNFDGDCSLREAIRAANTDAAVDACPAGNGADTINIPAGTYNLIQTSGDEDAKGDLDIQTDMTLQGAGADVTEIHSDMGERVMDVYSSIQVLVAGVTLSGGQDTEGFSGGGILSQGDFTLEDSIVIDNTASSGGGVWNSGTMTITRSIISNNTDNGNSGGAGLGGSPGTVTTLLDSTITENYSGHSGAGIYTFGGTFVLINTTISNNTSNSNSGGGIYISGTGQLYLINSTISGNASIDSNGGGIYLHSQATAYVYNTTIAGNSAANGGGLFNSGTFNLQNTIIADNTATTSGNSPDCTGTALTSNGFNLIGEDLGCLLTGSSTGMIVDMDPVLGPLQNNGGETNTHGLLYDSPARNTGNPAGCTDQNGSTLTTDQRGFPRPAGSACDMGAFESGLANLSLSMAESGDPVAIGEDLIYTLTVQNGGSQTATGVEVSATLPENTVFVSATPDQGSCTESGGLVTCGLDAIANGNDATVDILLAPFSTGTATLQASVTSNEIDTNLADNTGSESTTINPATDLTIIKTDSPDPAYTGALLTYRINVFTGPDAVTGVTMTDPLPGTFELDSISSSAGSCSGTSTVTCNLGSLSANTLVTVTITGSALTTDTLVNTVTVTGSPDSNPNNNVSTATTTMLLSADLALTITDDPDPVEIGSPLTYTLQVTNNGPSDANGVTLVDTLPPSLLSATPDPDQGTCDGTQIITCDLGMLASGATATIFIYVTTPDDYIGQISNNAQVSANEGDPDLTNNLASQNTQLIASNAVDLQMTKTASANQVSSGQVIVYTLLVENLNETLDATNVVVIDNLPLEVSLISATPSQGNCTGITCNLGTILAGGSATIQITVIVDEGLTGGTTIFNQANVDAGEFDNIPGNNYDNADVTVVEGFSIFLPITVR